MGAQLFEAESNIKVSAFGDFYSHSHKFRDFLPQIDYYGTPINDHPVLAVQVTRFSCSGFCVGISMSHVVADGKSAFHFIEEWARLARGKPLQNVPFLDRRVLQGVYDVNDKPNDVNHSFGQLRLNEGENWGKQASPIFVVLTKERIESLKKIANNIKEKPIIKRPYSWFEVIAAHVWRCVSDARQLHAQEITAFTVVVDSRARIKPPFPSR